MIEKEADDKNENIEQQGHPGPSAQSTVLADLGGSKGLHDLVTSIPTEIYNPFETVCNHFTSALRQQFRLHDNIAVHLDDKLLVYILQNKFSSWSSSDKASFLTALLPRKRMNDVLKPAAGKVIHHSLLLIYHSIHLILYSLHLIHHSL